MELTRLAGVCDKKDCPTVYATSNGTIAVQGNLVADLGLVRPSAGEAVVEIPLTLLLEAARAAQ